MKNILKIRTLFLILPLFFVYSCETVSSLSEKVYQTGVDTVDYVGSVFRESDEEIKNENESKDTKKEILSAKPSKNQSSNISENANLTKKSNENITESDQVLQATPTENLNIKKIESSVPSSNEFENNIVVDKEIESLKNTSPTKNNQEITKKSPVKIDFANFNNSLDIKDKIQFRIATINFSSGSSKINFKDVKKIKRVMKFASKKNAKVKIVGHASTRTKDMDPIKHKLANFNISDKRSQAVAKIFIDNKFPIKDLITEAVSDSKPLFYESMPAGTHGNQRTEIYIIY